MTEDDKGKVRSRLPQMRKGDDPEMVAEARASWRVLSRQLDEAFKVQRTRLELAMIAGRRWSPDSFQKIFVDHPLMTHLGQRLVWGEFERGADAPTHTFRVTQERELAGVDDDSFSLDGKLRISLVHPLQLSEPDRTAWGRIFADYEISPPFGQLDRPLFLPEDDDATSVERLQGQSADALQIRGRLEHRHWRRRLGEDGEILAFAKIFRAHGTTALVEFEPGISIKWDETKTDPEQTFTRVAFFETIDPESDLDDPVALGQASQIPVSEVLLDLQEVIDRSK